MALSQIVTRGYSTGSNGGTVNLIVVRGYGVSVTPPVTPTGNQVVPNTVAHLSQLFVKTVYDDPAPINPVSARQVPQMAPHGPTLRDRQREREFVAQRQQETDDWMAIVAIALHDMEDD